MNILQINSSILGTASESTRVANGISQKLVATKPGSTVTVRDLGVNPHPYLDAAALGAIFTPAEQRTAEQQARAALDDALIAEAQAADIIVIGAPMYNFSISIQLKAWLDAIARAGVTFRYTETGPEGLLKNKKVYIATSRGGVYNEENDPQIAPLRMLLGFLGLTDVSVIYASGLKMGDDAAAKGRSEADARIAAIL